MRQRATGSAALWYGRVLLVLRPRVLEQQLGDRGADLVAAADRGGRELELTLAPVEQAHQAFSRNAVAGRALDLEDAAIADEHACDLAVAQHEQDAALALELEQRQQRAEADVDEAATQA